MFIIKKYSENYQQQYCDLYISTWKVEPYGELFNSQEIINHLFVNKDYLFLLIKEDSDKIIGFVGGRPLQYECPFFINDTNIDVNITFYIGELGVDEKHKKFGWGQMLMHHLISCARENNFNQFVLRTHSSETNPAIKLYQKLGFNTKIDKNGKIHGIDTVQKRIDDRSEMDFRLYFYKTYSKKCEN